MLNLQFKTESDAFKLATTEYQNIWNDEGRKILNAFEAVTGQTFNEKEIQIIVYEGASFSGNLQLPMKLRASYAVEEKKGTLIHELGHRLLAPLQKRIENIDEHQTLNLFLYDVWEKLYGKDFADKMVAIESKRKGVYDYENAWNWALKMNSDERKNLFKKIVDLNSINL